MELLWMPGEKIWGYLKWSSQHSMMELEWLLSERFPKLWFLRKATDNLDHPWRPIIVIQSGFGRNKDVMRVVGEILWESMNVVYVRNRKWGWWNTQWIEYFEDLWNQKIDELKQRDSEIFSLWHSMGGVIAARIWLTNDIVSWVIQLASPNAGTPLFDQWFLDKNSVAQQMRNKKPYSDLSERLWLNILSVVASDDQVVPVSSQSSIHIPWGGGTIFVPTDHFGIVTDPRIINLIMKILESAMVTQ